MIIIGHIIMPVIQVRKLRHRKIHNFAQGHIALKEQSRDSNPGNLVPESTLVTIILTASHT